jgi:hypothetical protein
MKNRVQSVEGYLPMWAEQIAESNRLIVRERETVRAWKVADKRGKVFEREPAEKPVKVKLEMHGPSIGAEDRKWVRAWLKDNASAEERAAMEALRAKWAGYWDSLCKFTGGEAKEAA